MFLLHITTVICLIYITDSSSHVSTSDIWKQLHWQHWETFEWRTTKQTFHTFGAIFWPASSFPTPLRLDNVNTEQNKLSKKITINLLICLLNICMLHYSIYTTQETLTGNQPVYAPIQQLKKVIFPRVIRTHVWLLHFWFWLRRLNLSAKYNFTPILSFLHPSILDHRLHQRRKKAFWLVHSSSQLLNGLIRMKIYDMTTAKLIKSFPMVTNANPFILFSVLQGLTEI